MSSSSQPPFDPPLWLRNTHIQTIGSSLFARTPRLPETTRRELITTEGVRLEVFSHEVEPGVEEQPGQVILLHGWLGSADSSYILTAAADLLAAGHRVLRLNLRDHGNTAHLNKEMFHSARTQEVVDACVQLADRPTAIVGFSLGGNFALRVCANTSLPALAICPAIDPEVSCTAIDEGPAVYRHYFLRKWYRALAAKAAAFPALYDFDHVQNHTNVLALTNEFIGGHLPYPTSSEYFAAYRIRAEMLADKPAKIIAAKDDPVIPWQSVATLAATAELVLTERGGHCGYVPRQWIVSEMIEFARAQTQG